MAIFNGTPLDDILALFTPTNDALNGFAGNDVLNDDAGNDTLNGGTGDDIMSGGAGNNLYVVDSVNDTVNTTTGFDTIWIQTNTAITYDMSARATNTQVIQMFSTSDTVNHNIIGNALNNSMFGNNGANNINGGAGNDSIYGGGGNDTLDGGIGNDLLNGGGGDDTFIVDSASDQVQETAGQGNDTVISSVSYSLSANVENLTLTGTAVNATGNALDNTLIGTTGSNRLDGGTGADIMIGGGGEFGDSFIVDSLLDRVIANGTGDTPGNNTGRGVNNIFSSVSDVSLVVGANVVQSGNVYNLILTGTADLNGTGNDFNNFISGNSGNNIISGAAGNDFLNGQAGNDTINGGDGNDIIDGGTGADSLIGGAGSDAFYVDNLGDVIADGTASDAVYSSISTSLSNHDASGNIFQLNLIGTGGISGTGTAGANRIIGNGSNNILIGLAGNDSLSGLGGNDSLIGGAGNDTLSGGTGGPDGFVYDNSTAFADLGVDIITDFTSGQDKIYISRSVFGLSTAVNSGLFGEFAVVTTFENVTTSSAKIVYNSSTGSLYYNQNGIADGLGSGGLFAQLSGNPTLVLTDLLAVA